MKQKIHYLMILCLTASLIFTQVISVYACSPIFRPNYWYRLDYDIQNKSLPTDVTAIATHPDGNIGPDVESHVPTLGQLEFTNQSGATAYIVPDDALYNVDAFRGQTSQYAMNIVALADELAQNDDTIDLTTFASSFSNNIIEPNNTVIYDTVRGLRQLMENPQSPGGVDPPPPPFLYEPVIIQNNQLFTIPITITYSINPSYDENYTIYGAPLGDYLIQTDAVVLGKAIGAAADSGANGSYPDRDGNAQIVGYARIQVESWLLGDGPDEIEVGYFSPSPGSDCGKGMWMGHSAYFLLKAPDDTTSIRYPLTSDLDDARTVLIANSENAAAIEAALEELEELVPPPEVPATDKSTKSLFLPFISR